MTQSKLISKLQRIALALLFPLLILLLYKSTSSYFGDTDRYYHFALSKILSDQNSFSLSALPQAEDVGWGNFFPDKEFLFHAFTRIGFSLGGETGVVAVCLALAAATGIVIFAFSLGFLSPLSAFFCAFSVFFTHALIFRLLLVRPHVAALFFFALLNFALLRRRPVLTAFAAAGFVLAYHAFYLPLVCFGLAFALSRREPLREQAAWNKLLGLGLAGTMVGLVVNPYFPSQIAMGILHAKIPLLIAGGLKGANFGLELYPLTSSGALKFYYLPFAVILFAAWRFRASFQHSYLLALTMFFGILTFQTVRAGEYLILVTGMLLAVTAGTAFENRKVLVHRSLAALAVFQLVVLICVARLEANFNPEAELQENIKKALAFIPAGPAKVFNCEWDTAPYLLQLRPDLRFVDLLDPSFLMNAAPEKFREKRGLLSGNRADPFRLLKFSFGADYVLCRNLALSAQLTSDPHFQQLYPRSGASPLYLFRRAQAISPAFVVQYEVSTFSPASFEDAKNFQPAAEQKLQTIKLPEGGLALEQTELPPGALACKHTKVSAQEIQRLAGARYLGIGGGQAIRAWRNGKLIYASGPAFSRARSLQALVPLLKPIAAGDSLDFLVCSSGESPWISLAVSLWTDKEALAVCEWKRASLTAGHRPRSESAYSSDQESCLGPMASPTVPPELRP